eukprot:TRINITY_DN82787_c0_g1_i1.p1 TRINITY_DN82787_c0_g1~~TRINITY_DN82787_c0_g1_i1.p1  ORF type:complete len:464 (-),score=111.14 TRINITY_DN82787_c0_g1_i1:65-1456(-)
MLATGSRVRLHGLQAKPELNGKQGVLKDRKLDTGRWTVALDDGADVALKASNIELLPLQPHGSRGPAVAASSSSSGAPGAGAVEKVLEEFDKLIWNLETKCGSVLDALVYCMDNALLHAVPLANRLASSIGQMNISTDQQLARLYLLNDVLHNSGSKKAPGATQYRTAFQEMLPETFEKLGRYWLWRQEEETEQIRCEEAVRKVLNAWEKTVIFPIQYIKGLESVLFTQIREVSAKEAATEQDEKLKTKLQRWFSGMTQSELPTAVLQRGLCGRPPSTAHCRSLLCHFERYWHIRPDSKVKLRGLQNAPHLNGLVGTCIRWDFHAGRWKVRLLDSGDIKSVKQDNLLSEDTQIPPAPAAAPRGTPQPAPKKDDDEDSIDGQPLTAEELKAVVAMERAARKASYRGKGRPILLGDERAAIRVAGCGTSGTGTWTQVCDEPTPTKPILPRDFVERHSTRSPGFIS